MKQPFEKIAGRGWTLWITDGPIPYWDGDGDVSEIIKMVETEFPQEVVRGTYLDNFVITHGTQFGPLYGDVVEFFGKWGVEAAIQNKQPFEGESGPRD